MASNQVITVLNEQAVNALTAIERRQFPFAFAKTLTDLAKAGQDGVKRVTRNNFDLHTEWIPGGIGKKSAKKSQVKSGRAHSKVFSKPGISTFMPIHEKGGVRTPNAGGAGRDMGKYLTVPAMALEDQMVTSTGKTKKSFQPSVLLKNYNGNNNRTPRGGPKKKGRGTPFIIRSKGSDTGLLVRRRGIKRKPLEVLYIFSEDAKYKPVWDFEKTVVERVIANARRTFTRNLAFAVATAR